MAVDYRLRQIALVSADLNVAVAALSQAFGLKVGFSDPGVAAWGLVNAILPVGNDFIEVLQPVVENSPAGRHLRRRGADCAYMIILQAADALAERRRLAAAGITGVDHMGGPEDVPAAAVGFTLSPDAAANIKNLSRRHAYTHFHPRDFMGVLVSIDSTLGDKQWAIPESDWYPAGANWRAARTSGTLGLASVTVQHADPVAMSARWSALLDLPLASGASCALPFARGRIEFVRAKDPTQTGIVGIDIAVPDPSAALAKAAAAGLATQDGAISIVGTAFRPVLATSAPHPTLAR